MKKFNILVFHTLSHTQIYVYHIFIAKFQWRQLHFTITRLELLHFQRSLIHAMKPEENSITVIRKLDYSLFEPTE